MTQRSWNQNAALLDGISPSGRHSAFIKRLRKLSADPATQRTEGLAFAEGVHLASELIASGLEPEHVLLSPRILRRVEGEVLVQSLMETQAPAKLHRIEDSLMAQLSNSESHQGIVCVISRTDWSWQDVIRNPGMILVACGVQDPGNIGTLARTTEAAWGSGLICTGEGADPWSARALRASAGSTFRLPVLHIADAGEAIARLKEAGFMLVGADPRARNSYKEPLGSDPLALFCGNEGTGLSPEHLSAMDRRIRIPTKTRVESLNVAAAAAVMLFEAASQRPTS